VQQNIIIQKVKDEFKYSSNKLYINFRKNILNINILKYNKYNKLL